jgi:hypothetical protein
LAWGWWRELLGEGDGEVVHWDVSMVWDNGSEGDELRTAVWQLDEGDRARAWRNRGAAR